MCVETELRCCEDAWSTVTRFQCGYSKGPDRFGRCSGTHEPVKCGNTYWTAPCEACMDFKPSKQYLFERPGPQMGGFWGDSWTEVKFDPMELCQLGGRGCNCCGNTVSKDDGEFDCQQLPHCIEPPKHSHGLGDDDGAGAGGGGTGGGREVEEADEIYDGDNGSASSKNSPPEGTRSAVSSPRRKNQPTESHHRNRSVSDSPAEPRAQRVQPVKRREGRHLNDGSRRVPHDGRSQNTHHTDYQSRGYTDGEQPRAKDRSRQQSDRRNKPDQQPRNDHGRNGEVKSTNPATRAARRKTPGNQAQADPLDRGSVRRNQKQEAQAQSQSQSQSQVRASEGRRQQKAEAKSKQTVGKMAGRSSSKKSLDQRRL